MGPEEAKVKNDFASKGLQQFTGLKASNSRDSYKGHKLNSLIYF